MGSGSGPLWSKVLNMAGESVGIEGRINDAILERGLVDTCRMMRGGSASASVTVPLVGGWIAYSAGTDVSIIVAWSTAVFVVSLATVACCSLALRAHPWSEPRIWLRRVHLALGCSGVANGLGVLLVDPWKRGRVDPLWAVSLMMFSAILAVNVLLGFGLRVSLPAFSLPIVIAAIVSCLRLGGLLGSVLGFGCVVYCVVILGTNRIAGDAFRRATELRVRNDHLIADLEAANGLLERRAHSDVLTGLANRAGLWSELERREGDPDDTTVLFIDLDGFKPINDLFGHIAGDEVLRIVANRLTRIVRTGDIVARMGGDEFVIVARGFDDSDADAFGDRVRRSIQEPMSIHGNQIEISAAIGVATHVAEHTMQTTLAEADKLMYAMKRAHRQSV